MGAFHVFKNCTNGTKLHKTPQLFWVNIKQQNKDGITMQKVTSGEMGNNLCLT